MEPGRLDRIPSHGLRAMTLAPLLEAPPPIALHAMAAMAAFALGIVQFAAPKGTIPHRTIGWIFVGLMLAVALSSLLLGALVIAGAFTLVPGRIMHQVVFGSSPAAAGGDRASPQ